MDINTQALLSLARTGLWEICNNSNSEGLKVKDPFVIDWPVVHRLASEQAVLGLVLAGLDHSEVKPSQGLLLQWICEIQMQERQNKAMNAFLAELVNKLRAKDI